MVDYKNFYCGNICILLGYAVLVFINDTSPYKQGVMQTVIILLTAVGILFQMIALYGAYSSNFTTLFVAQWSAFLYLWCYFFLSVFIGLLNVPNLCFFALAAGFHVHMFISVNSMKDEGFHRANTYVRNQIGQSLMG